MDFDQAFTVYANTFSQLMVGLLVGGVLLIIGRMYTPRRARIHYYIAGLGFVLYLIAITVFQTTLDFRRLFLGLALLFVVYYGNRARLYLQAMELQLSRLKGTDTPGPMVCTVNVNIGGVVYQCQRYQYHRGQHEVVTDKGSIKWTGVL